MDDWPIAELVGYVGTCLAEMPQSKNGQVRAVPDERTVRYYGTIGLLDKPIAMRGRTALYGRKHVAQILAIKRLQADGRSLAEIQAVWSQLDDVTLSRMSGVQFPPRAPGRKEFWKDEPKATTSTPTPAPIELRIELAAGVMLCVAMPDAGVAISKADIDAIRAAAAAVVTELARRQLTMNDREEKT